MIERRSEPGARSARRGARTRRAPEKTKARAPRECTVPVIAELDPALLDFYRGALVMLNRLKLPYLVGGAYALNCYAGVTRHTRDFDLFLLRRDYAAIAAAFEGAGFRTELMFPHWLGKAFLGGDYIDLIFSGGNGEAVVDEEWFAHAREAEIFGVPVRICPVEEMIWSKSFIMERERFDGADVAHLIRSSGERLDWDRLIRRFGALHRVLYAHLVLFGFTYPGERHKVPAAVMRRLAALVEQETAAGDTGDHLCQGTLLSREQYLVDVEIWGYDDARLAPEGAMSREDIRHWTAAIDPGK
jgi:hypothetical protein